VVMNPQKMGRVLDNLVGNAIRYGEGGGAVLVEAHRNATGVTVSVEDDGPGFAADELPRVFEQFYRGEGARSRKRGGAGLGLAIAQAIVGAHGGHIWAENKSPSGARIVFVLPDGDRGQ
jgi:signal transduction histidine kinase